MRVVIDGVDYYPISEVAEDLLRIVNQEKQDLSNEEEKSGFETAVGRMYSRLKELGYKVYGED